MAYFVEYRNAYNEKTVISIDLSRAIYVAASATNDGTTFIGFGPNESDVDVHVAENYDRVKSDMVAAGLFATTKD